MNLINRPVNRLFAFGCSFTHYSWATWPEYVAYDLDIPYYNYGKSGAGNQYITNAIVQANLTHKFNEDDLIMVSWTNVCREDRWRKNTWVNTGNIYTQGFFDNKFIREWADPVGYMVRDFASINLVRSMLTNIGCQYHMMSMCDITEQVDQQSHKSIPEEAREKHNSLCELYKDDLDSIRPSFFRTLWNNDVYTNKLVHDVEILGKLFSDGHPSPSEHFTYLKKSFTGHKFKEETKQAVAKAHLGFVQFIAEHSAIFKKPFALHELDHGRLKMLRRESEVKAPMPSQII